MMTTNRFRAAVVTDLDGTLLNHERRVSDRDLETLNALRADGVVCAIATGRSLYSARRVLDPDLPVDYLLFSSGSGIMDWARQKLVRARSLSGADVRRIAAVLEEEGINYMVHEPIPENHRFVYREVRAEDTDFRRRCEFYQGMCAPIATPTVQVDAACQVIGILKPDPERFNRVRDRLEEFSVVRTTSPMDGHNMWMEIFPYCVSKSAGSEWLMTWLGIDVEHRTYALGNDYNDLDLLAWAAHSAVTDNAPDELKHIFEVTVSNNDHALSEAVRAWGLLGGEGGGEREG